MTKKLFAAVFCLHNFGGQLGRFQGLLLYRLRSSWKPSARCASQSLSGIKATAASRVKQKTTWTGSIITNPELTKPDFSGSCCYMLQATIVFCGVLTAGVKWVTQSIPWDSLKNMHHDVPSNTKIFHVRTCQAFFHLFPRTKKETHLPYSSKLSNNKTTI